MIYTIRLDAPYNKKEDREKFSPVVKHLLQWLEATKYLIFYELSSKVKKYHWQGWFYTDKSMSTTAHAKHIINKYITKNKLPADTWLAHRRTLAKVQQYDDYVRYCAKDNEITHDLGYTKEEIQRILKLGAKAKADFIANTPKKKTIKNILLERTDSLFTDSKWYSHEEHAQKRIFGNSLATTIFRVYAELNVSFDAMLYRRHLQFLINSHIYHWSHDNLLDQYKQLTAEILFS